MNFIYPTGVFIISSILFVTLGFIDSKALAQDSCTFSNAINGSLGADFAELTVLSSEIAVSNITAIDGNPGAIDVTCTNAAINIKITGVNQSNDAGIALSNFTTTLKGLSSNLTSSNGGASVAVPIGTSNTKTLEIDLTATYNSTLKPGNYNFLINLEALP